MKKAKFHISGIESDERPKIKTMEKRIIYYNGTILCFFDWHPKLPIASYKKVIIKNVASYEQSSCKIQLFAFIEKNRENNLRSRVEGNEREDGARWEGNKNVKSRSEQRGRLFVKQ